jgi:hypothetical protein
VRAAAALLLAACAGAGDETPVAIDDGVARVAPANTIPCNHPEYWPYSVASASPPLRVHYERPSDWATARQVLGLLEQAWQVEVGQLGWRPPPSDGARCGPDGAFDTFLWRGHVECYVDVLDGGLPYLVVDPWGEYGGPILDSTVAHEFNHACQAADDWNDLAIAYEMTADFMQKIAVPTDQDYARYFADFQARPGWSLDHDDGLVTWYEYGASLYLFYLRDRHFGGDARFVADVWLGLRGPATFEDSVDAILRARAGTTFMDSVAGFARWRWYGGAHDDGRHFALGLAQAPAATAARAEPGTVTVAPMLLGSSYVDLAGGGAPLTVSLESDAPARWVLQAVPGLDGGDGETLAPDGATLRFGADGTRTLIVTALPIDPARYDPRRRHDAHLQATVRLVPSTR